MIPLSLRILAVCASGGYLLAILAALRSSKMNVRQSLLWLLSGFVFLVMSAYPFPLVRLAMAMGFVVASNAAFVVWLLVLTTLIFYQSLTTSKQAAQIKTLCQEIAMLRAGSGSPKQ